ncbi:MAG: hypothetical protein OEW95_08975 [Candidatus Bathyarchaeota archaeon]|nr:hypothetical protein [Candidatus Bathyarchaeota archaeon]
MEFRTEIEWKKGTRHSLEKLKEHLKTFEITKKTALNKFYPKVDDEIASKVFFAIKCGDSPKKSVFLFHLGTSDSSEISGKCLRDSTCDLKRDWSFLKEKIDELELGYKATHTKIILNSEILEKTSFSSYLKRKEILAFLVSSAGIPSLASTFVTAEFSLTFFVSLFVGLICWFMISYYGHCQEGDYAFK